MTERILCESCRRAEFIGSKTRLKCGTKGAVTAIRRIKAGQSPMYVCVDYEKEGVYDR